jgi:putative membrane protein insertion efficiency factor
VWPLAVAALAGLIAGDSARPPETQWGARAAIAILDGYRAVVSPVFARTGLIRCRFTPTCSAYAREALHRYGTVRGAAMGAGRLLRCHPFAEGGFDPVPVR